MNDQYNIRLTEFERRLVVNGLLSLRQSLAERDVPSEEVDDLILKIIDSQERKERWRDDHEER
ncbi:MAG: hypothetical protein IJK95_05485 [Firmicutes bacterium]|nr:hypothetical protein [Bacillota bacterium]